MLHEPEKSIVQAWYAAGHEPTHVPFGIGGAVFIFSEMARRSGYLGAFKRYGGAHIEPEALAFVGAGEISVAQARVGIVWLTLRQCGAMHASQMARELGLYKAAAKHTLVELVEIGAAMRVPHPRFEIYEAAALHRAPHWTDYLPARMRAA